MTGELVPATGGKRRIASWQVAAGALAHVVVPAYLVAVPIACFVAAPAGATLVEMARSVPLFSGWFVAAYAALGLVAVVGAMALDRLADWRNRGREARDPRYAALVSARRVTLAISDGRKVLDDPASATLASLRRASWDHDDPRYQALSRDLAEVVRTSSAAIASAAPERRPELRALAAGALGDIDAALGELGAERARLDEGDARVMARYVRLRLTQSDSAGEAP